MKTIKELLDQELTDIPTVKKINCKSCKYRKEDYRSIKCEFGRSMIHKILQVNGSYNKTYPRKEKVNKWLKQIGYSAGNNDKCSLINQGENCPFYVFNMHLDYIILTVGVILVLGLVAYFSIN